MRESAEQLQKSTPLYYARSEAIKRGGQVLIQKNTQQHQRLYRRHRDPRLGLWLDRLPRHQRQRHLYRCRLRSTTRGIQRESTRQPHQRRRRHQLNRWGLVGRLQLGFNLVPLDKTVSHVCTHAASA